MADLGQPYACENFIGWVGVKGNYINQGCGTTWP